MSLCIGFTLPMLEDVSYPLKRGIQTSITLPYGLYLQTIEQAKAEGVSFSEIVRRAVKKELEGKKFDEGKHHNIANKDGEY